MTDLLSRLQAATEGSAALSAAMRGGTASWGQRASATEHVRYCEPAPDKRRRCRCGCKGAATHLGKAQGIALMGGCEMSVRRWVRNPADHYAARLRAREAGR